ncbi:MAG: hypothetical protein NT107_05335 [Planctomycetota bacterium]|nr:hypothetical protein [Planctomycetota bacterium]
MDEGDKGKGRVVLLDLIEGARILVAPARALPQRFFMTTKITEECRFQPLRMARRFARAWRDVPRGEFFVVWVCLTRARSSRAGRLLICRPAVPFAKHRERE